MSCSSSNTISEAREQFPLEQRPRLLKDFLIDDANSCSFSGFKSFARTSPHSTIRTHIRNNGNNSYHNSLPTRSPSKTTISTFQAMINAVKKFHFTTAVKSPSFLPRSLSRRLSSSKKSTYGESRRDNNKEADTKVIVTIKDIIRWRSFRDIVEEPLDFIPPSSHHDAVTTTTTTTTTVSASSTPYGRSSNRSSWSDSDFTAECLPSWSSNYEDCFDADHDEVKKYLPRVGENPMDKAEERQQNSPVSVIGVEFEEDEEGGGGDEKSSSFERSKQKLMQKIQRFESLARAHDIINLGKWMSMDEISSSVEENEEEEDRRETNAMSHLEEKTWQVLNNVQETCSHDDIDVERRVEGWTDGDHCIWDQKEACVKEMEKNGKWSEFEEEGVLAVVIESALLRVLVDDLLIDLIS